MVPVRGATFCAALFQEPPRITRWADAPTNFPCGLDPIKPIDSRPVRGSRKKPCPGIGMGRDGQGRVVGSLQLRRVDRPGLVNAASAR